MRRRLRIALGSVLFLVAALPMGAGPALGQASKPNILEIWGDDIGTWNVSQNNLGMMGYRDKLKQGVSLNGRTYRNHPGGLENRGRAFGVWREPFTDLRVPLLFNLRRDPFERAQENSNTYNDWFLDRVFVIVPLQAIAGEFLKTMKDYPPGQNPGSFNLEKIQKQIEAGSAGGN